MRRDSASRRSRSHVAQRTTIATIQTHRNVDDFRTALNSANKFTSERIDCETISSSDEGERPRTDNDTMRLFASSCTYREKKQQ